MDGIINVRINGNHLTKDSRRAGVQHEGNATKLLIEFDDGWTGYAKTVTFWNALGANPVQVVLTTDKLVDIIGSLNAYQCPIPPEAMTEAGELTFVVDGYTDGIRKRSISDVLEVIAAPFDPEADEPTDPTPRRAEQLQLQIDAIIGTIQNAEGAANSAATSAQNAELSAQNAELSAQNASESATNASLSETAAGESAVRAEINAGVALEAAAYADANRLGAESSVREAEASKTKAEDAARRAEDARNNAAQSEANACNAKTETERIAQRAEDALAQVTDITDKHTEVMATAYQVAQDAARAEAAAKEAEQIADGDFATPAEVEFAVTTHNADSNAHLIIDNTTYHQYKWGMENGLVYLEEVK